MICPLCHAPIIEQHFTTHNTISCDHAHSCEFDEDYIFYTHFLVHLDKSNQIIFYRLLINDQVFLGSLNDDFILIKDLYFEKCILSTSWISPPQNFLSNPSHFYNKILNLSTFI